MRAEERDPANLWDMIEAARAVVEFTEGVSLEEFLAADQKSRSYGWRWSGSWK